MPLIRKNEEWSRYPRCWKCKLREEIRVAYFWGEPRPPKLYPLRRTGCDEMHGFSKLLNLRKERTRQKALSCRCLLTSKIASSLSLAPFLLHHARFDNGGLLCPSTICFISLSATEESGLLSEGDGGKLAASTRSRAFLYVVWHLETLAALSPRLIAGHVLRCNWGISLWIRYWSYLFSFAVACEWLPTFRRSERVYCQHRFGRFLSFPPMCFYTMCDSLQVQSSVPWPLDGWVIALGEELLLSPHQFSLQGDRFSLAYPLTLKCFFSVITPRLAPIGVLTFRPFHCWGRYRCGEQHISCVHRRGKSSGCTRSVGNDQQSFHYLWAIC